MPSFEANENHRSISATARKLEPSFSKSLPHLQVSSPPYKACIHLARFKGGKGLPICPGFRAFDSLPVIWLPTSHT